MTAPTPPAPCCGPTRRQLFRGAGAAAGAVVGASVLGACAESTDPGESAASVSSAGAGTVVIALAEVPVGGAASAEVGGQPVLVTQPVEGEVHVFSAVCTHQGCTVVPGDGELECPCHRSRFTLEDAAVLGGPASEPLGEVSVTVVDGDVVLA
ncbi:Rieske (2Fe-2S) protein [Isoptericola variabilis]|uniref:Cytochrome bc1 complex Rieske iron-sulfur subunit n=1 Tax=Isoptericola variabilis (strain 225) TaxID=743718 RepID=F6FT10_ISOV2|nr:Rieske (2Fe-2S) protein [Isoptericola variabilis]AEG44081.1 Rieske (2Fe-2S) iron-sulfur domain protein [Isoptericola variabilis 225]TWH27163.1 nitrite reductase/ring-hydroxylating ferredoxin subunit [Isoptericola variabilis J7]TWH28770.1 nitrite reductase/ring-hydroxylating ferredoxin subunit [Isoptericola variabilis J7]